LGKEKTGSNRNKQITIFLILKLKTMKIKFGLEIHHHGDANDSLVRMITNHNSGEVVIDLDLIKKACLSRYAQWPGITPNFEFVEDISIRTEVFKLEIYEVAGGKRIKTLTITEKAVYELEEPGPMPVKEGALIENNNL
jgi:hypothetical protein